MTKTIWKYPLEVTDEQRVVMPRGAEILSVQVQGKTVCLWALVDPRAATIHRTIFIHGTGHEFDDGETKFIGTFQLSGGALIFHVFDRGDMEPWEEKRDR